MALEVDLGASAEEVDEDPSAQPMKSPYPDVVNDEKLPEVLEEKEAKEVKEETVTSNAAQKSAKLAGLKSRRNSGTNSVGGNGVPSPRQTASTPPQGKLSELVLPDLPHVSGHSQIDACLT
jgi:hypothetical protein